MGNCMEKCTEGKEKATKKLQSSCPACVTPCGGTRVPSCKQGKAHKFARPFRGPHRIVNLYDNGADIRPVDRPQQATTRVALNRLRKCPKGYPGPDQELMSGDVPSAGPAVETDARDKPAKALDKARAGSEPRSKGPEKVTVVGGDDSHSSTSNDPSPVATETSSRQQTTWSNSARSGIWAGRLRKRKKQQDSRGRAP